MPTARTAAKTPSKAAAKTGANNAAGGTSEAGSAANGSAAPGTAGPAAASRPAAPRMKQIEVSILGQAYTLGCPEDGELLLTQAVASVDREMTSIRDAGKVKARERIAVLAALNLAYQIAEQQGLAAAPPPGPPPAPARARAQADGEVAEMDVDDLLRRVDAALADDGQLL